MNQVFTPLQQLLVTWLLILITGWLTLVALGYVGETISILLTAGLIAFLLNYAVAALTKFLPRTAAALLVYLFAAAIIALIGVTIAPPLFNQGRQLVNRFPALLESARQQLSDLQIWTTAHNLPFDLKSLTFKGLEQLQAQTQAIASSSFELVLGTFNWFLDLILILVISFYMLVDGERLWKSVTRVFTPRIQIELTYSLQRNLQQFVFGQLVLGVFMATTLTIAFFVLRVPFFLLFAVFIGIMEVLPFIGATLGIATVVLIVSFIDWRLALEVLAVAIALQQVKDNLVAPRILGNLTGLSPVVIFVALLMGAKIGGLLGVILAIPMTGVIKSLAEIVSNPALPPQTGAFFQNPFAKRIPELNPEL